MVDRMSGGDLPVLRPNLQIAFYYRLQAVRDSYFHESLRTAIQSVDLSTVDAELASYVTGDHLSKVASFGVRGEVFFPVPCLLRVRPTLLGYYRLLYGLSQKEFYRGGRFSRFKRLEERGEMSAAAENQLSGLCKSLIFTAQELVDGIDDLSVGVVHDLQLLTIGAQLRGAQNTLIGKTATAEIFSMIETLVRPYILDRAEGRLRLRNESGRTVVVAFASDPDIAITEEMPSGVRPQVSIEIKGGTDVSNVHNRIGEAEKSHQKAKDLGFFEFWTILGAHVEPDTASRESPSTSRFFQLSELRDENSEEYGSFRDHFQSVIGIRDG